MFGRATNQRLLVEFHFGFRNPILLCFRGHGNSAKNTSALRARLNISGRRKIVLVSLLNSHQSILLLFLLPSDKCLQHGSLITFPKEENLGNTRKPIHQVYLPSVPTYDHRYYYYIKCLPSNEAQHELQRWSLKTFFLWFFFLFCSSHS